MRVIWGVPDTPQARKTGSRINYWLPAVFILFKLDSYSFIFRLWELSLSTVVYLSL